MQIDADGETLHIAAKPIVYAQGILNNRTDVNIVSRMDWTALELPVRCGHFPLVSVPLQHAANPDIQGSMYRQLYIVRVQWRTP